MESFDYIHSKPVQINYKIQSVTGLRVGQILMKSGFTPDNCNKSTKNGNPDYELVSFW